MAINLLIKPIELIPEAARRMLVILLTTTINYYYYYSKKLDIFILLSHGWQKAEST